MTAAALEVVWEAVTARRCRHQQLQVLAPWVRTLGRDPALASSKIIRAVSQPRDHRIWLSLVIVDGDGRHRAASVIIDFRCRQPVLAVDVL